MSRYLGKLLVELEGGLERVTIDDDTHYITMHYVKKSDTFVFRVFGIKGGGSMSFKSKFLRAVLSDEKDNSWQTAWSVGYKTRIRTTDVKALYYDECKVLYSALGLGGEDGVEMDSGVEAHKALVLEGYIDNDEDFFMLSRIQYLYNLSWSKCVDAKRQWKRFNWGRGTHVRWIRIPGRNLNMYRGRAKGALGKEKEVEENAVPETDEEFKARYEHNISWAVKKGYVGSFLEAEKERVIRSGNYWTANEKKKSLNLWVELRK